MKVSDLTTIPDPYAQFIQSMKFLRSIQDTEQKAAEIRDRALLELRNPENEKRMTLRELADTIGVSTQRLSRLEQKARSRYES